MKYCIFIMALLIIISCNDEKKINIKKVPCNKEINFNHEGNLHGKYITFYFVVRSNVKRSKLIDSLDSFVKNERKLSMISRYANITWRFLVDKKVLRSINDCKTAEKAELQEGRHLRFAEYFYDSTSKLAGKVVYDKKGRVSSTSTFKDSILNR